MRSGMQFNNAPPMGASSSQRGTRSDSKSNQQSNSPLASASSSLSGNLSAAQPNIAVVQSKDISEETLKKIQSICKTVLTSHQNDEFKEYSDLDNAPTLDKIAQKDRWAIIRELYNLSAELKGLNEADRVFVGLLCSFWVNRNSVSKEDYVRGLTEYLDLMEDLQIDVPKIWEWSVETICKF